MSFERFFHWTCDACGKQEVRADYGLPRGWIAVKAMKTTNRCEACKLEIPPKQWIIPDMVANR